MSKEKQRDEAGQFGGVYGSKNKAVREKATRDLLKKLGIKNLDIINKNTLQKNFNLSHQNWI